MSMKLKLVSQIIELLPKDDVITYPRLNFKLRRNDYASPIFMEEDEVAEGNTAAKSKIGKYSFSIPKFVSKTLTLPGTENQTITLTYTEPGKSPITVTSTSIDQEFNVQFGTEWRATVSGTTEYNVGTLSTSSGKIKEDTVISITEASLKTYALTLAGTINQVVTLNYTEPNGITVTKTSTNNNQTFIVVYGTTWTATVEGNTGYNAGGLSSTSGTVTSDIIVNVAAASLKTYTLTLAGTTNQVITLKYTEPNGSEVTKTSTGTNQEFTVKHGTTWTATVAASTSWNAGTLTATSGTITSATIISVGEATYKTFMLKLSAMNTNQTITLKYKNKKSDGTFDSEVSKTSTGSDQSFTVGYGTTWTATVSPSTGWVAGALSPGSSGTITETVTVSVAAATYKTFTLTKSVTNASTNQTLTVQYQNKTSSGTFETKTTLSSGSVTLGYGSHWWGTVSPSTGWNAGAVTNAGGDSSSLTSDVTVSVAAATHKTVTLTKSATNASTNQTLTVKYKDYNGSSYAAETTLSSGSATVGYGTTWTASVSPSTGYNAGALSPGSSGTATANVTVSVGAATRQTYTLTLAGTTNQTITLKYTQPGASAVTKTSTSSNQSFTVQYGTTWTASIAAANGYNPGTLSASSGTITGNTTVSVSEATLAAIVLTDSNYKMSDVYPSIYQTMTTVPDALNTSKVTDMNNMFYFCSSLTTVPELNTSNVTNMNNMFYNCTSLTTIPQLNTSKVTDMNNMFYFCNSLKTIPQLNTSNVTNMNNIFGSCGNLKTIPQLDTSKVTDMGSMFNSCVSLTTISQLNTSKVTYMKSMFQNCSSLPSTFPWTIDCSSISDDYDMKNMFTGSSVTNVTLKNVNSSIRSKVTSSRLKGNNTLTIKFA